MYGDRRDLEVGAFISPKSVAIIGGSREVDSLTARPRKYLAGLGYAGDVTIVHPSGMAGGPYRTVTDIAYLPNDVDVALIMLSAERVAESLEACAASGIHNAIVLASNLSTGTQGCEEILRVLAAYPELRLLGPNCLGVVAPRSSTYLTFSGALHLIEPVPGPVALVTQSGAIGNALLLSLTRRGVGVDCWLSTGDERDIGALEAAVAVAREVRPKSIGLFVEGITDIRFLPELELVIRDLRVPIVAVRAGVSELGQVAALGHTGKVVKNASIVQQLLGEAGVTIVDSLQELCDSLCLLSLFARPPRRPEVDVAVLAPSGGLGVMAADAVASSTRVRLASLSEEAVEIREILAEFTNDGSVSNPLDVPGVSDPEAFEKSACALRSSTRLDAVVAVVTELVNALDELSVHPPGGPVPMVLSCLSPDEPLSLLQRRRLAAAGIPVIDDVSAAIRCIDRWAHLATTEPSYHPVSKQGEEQSSGRPEQRGILGAISSVGSALDRWLVATVEISTESEALNQAAQLGYPVVVKSEGTAIAHRALAGAVRLGLLSPADVSAAFREISDVAMALGDGVVMQSEVGAGIDLMMSAIRDPEAGCVVLCKYGGSRAEDSGPKVLFGRWDSEWRRRLTASALGRDLESNGADLDGLLSMAEVMISLLEGDAGIVEIECNPVIVPVGGGEPQIVDLLSFRIGRRANK